MVLVFFADDSGPPERQSPKPLNLNCRNQNHEPEVF